MTLIEVFGAKAVVRRQETLTVGRVGAEVEFVFDDSWDGLYKTAVFQQGDVARDRINIGNVVKIPPEVLQMAGIPVEIGVFGANADGSVVIPTVWAKTRPVLPGADPSGDESTDPTLPVWARLQAMIGDMNELDTEIKESLVAAINEVLAKANTGGSGEGGTAGVGVASIEQTKTSTESGGENEITITLTDGTKKPFVFYNGAKGSDGAKGEKGEPGEQGLQGEKGETGAQAPLAPRVPRAPRARTARENGR